MTVKIMIDAGHGGKDPGAIGNGLMEKHVTLDIAKRIEKILDKEYTGHDTRLTRYKDETVPLKTRTDMANNWNATCFISIHINAGKGVGFESFIYDGGVGSSTVALQNTVHASLIRTTSFNDRGKKRANFHVLRETKMSALLTENGFIDNPHDASKLKNPDFLELVARKHVEGLARMYGLKKKKVAQASTKGKLYHVQIGAFANKENAERLANELRAKGYDTYITTK